MSLQLFPKNDQHQFQPILTEIEDDPGNPLGPIMFWLLIAVVLFFLIWTIFGEVDIVVSSRGKVIPVGQVKLIQPLTGGVVSRILVKEGDFVKKGQPLVEIDPATTAPELEASRETLNHIQLEQARLQASSQEAGRHIGRPLHPNRNQENGSDDAETQARLYDASIASLEKQLSAKEQALANLDAQVKAKQVEVQHSRETLQINLDKEKRLSEVQDIIAKDDMEKVENDLLTDRNKLKELSHELEELAFQKQQTREEMAYLQQNFKSTTLTDLADKQKQVNQLKATIQESAFKNARQTLIAPVDGYIHELFIHTVGGVVTPAQKVLSLVPANMPLIVQATVFNKDIGFVKTGMPVALKIDTYDFQKYGTLKATVSQIDRDSRDDQRLGAIYTVYMTPLQHALRVDGKWQSLSSGLNVTAEVKTGKRHIIEFFIYPLIKHLNEGMSVR